jgi:hypothetical protein
MSFEEYFIWPIPRLLHIVNIVVFLGSIGSVLSIMDYFMHISHDWDIDGIPIQLRHAVQVMWASTILSCIITIFVPTFK